MEDNELKTKIIKNVRENIAVSNIRKELDMDKVKDKKIFYKVVLAACAMFVISVAIITNNISLDANIPNDNIEIDTEDKVTISSTDGIKIPKLEIPEPSSTEELCMAYAYIVYNGQFYTSAESISMDKKDMLMGEYLGEIKNILNEYFESDYYKNATTTSLPYLKEFMEEKMAKDSRVILGDRSGKVYKVKGYNTDFRICYLDEVNNQITIYERLNDITLKYGKDLFEDRLKLKEKYDFVEYQYHQDWNSGKNNFRKFTEVTTEDIEQFIDEINNAEFIDATGLDRYSIKKKQAHLYFRIKDGTTVKIRLHEDGYVSYEGWSSNVIIKVDTETFRKIFNEATPEIYTYSEEK